jgi:uncharacterized protein (TIGR02001 family)
MNALKLALAAAAAALAVGGVAHAEDAKPFAFTFNVGAATDYVFRGVSQTDENPQIFGGVDATIGSIGYAGLWASNVDFNNGTNMEYDLYAGIKPALGPVTLDLGVIRYGYTNQPSGPDENYWEGKVAASAPFGPATFGAAVYYSDDFFGETGPATYYEINGSSTIPNTKFSVSGAVGRQQVKGPFDYSTWNLGVGYAVTDHFGLDLRYLDTDEHGFGDIYDSRVVLGLKATF